MTRSCPASHAAPIHCHQFSTKKVKGNLCRENVTNEYQPGLAIDRPPCPAAQRRAAAAVELDGCGADRYDVGARTGMPERRPASLVHRRELHRNALRQDGLDQRRDDTHLESQAIAQNRPGDHKHRRIARGPTCFACLAYTAYSSFELKSPTIAMSNLAGSVPASCKHKQSVSEKTRESQARDRLLVILRRRRGRP